MRVADAELANEGLRKKETRKKETTAKKRTDAFSGNATNKSVVFPAAGAR